MNVVALPLGPAAPAGRRALPISSPLEHLNPLIGVGVAWLRPLNGLPDAAHRRPASSRACA